MTILVVNAGSSSIKFSLFERYGEELVRGVHGKVQAISGEGEPRFVALRPDGGVAAERRWPHGARLGHAGALEALLDYAGGAAGTLSAVGHRVVHGGAAFTAPARVDEEVLARLQTFVPLAPLHQPHNLRPIRLLRDLDQRLPQVACFDTSFHRTLPPVAERFALPEELFAAGVRRYGFHGLSYEHVARSLPSLDERAASGRTVAMHLGNGASMCALSGGRSVATTMGFSVLDGLVMGTRCGSLDPGVLLWLMGERGLDLREVEELLYDRSGLLGVSGLSSDMRALLASPDPRAHLAVDLFVHRMGRELGSLAAALGGLDAIVLTGGIGENAAPIRERVCRDAAWLGVELDPEANDAGARRITTDRSRVAAFVLAADEELTIARHVVRVLDEAGEETKMAQKTSTVQATPSLSAFGKARSTVTGAARAGGAAQPRRVLARVQLPRGGHDLPAGQPAPARAAPPRAREEPAARPLGRESCALVRVHAPQPRHPRAGSRRAVHRWARPRRPRRDRPRLSRRDLLRGLSGQGPRRGRAAPVPEGLLVPRRRREPLHARAARLHPRGRRARVLALPRLRRGVRQPRADRRRGGRGRRGGDGAARDLVAREQVPESDPRRRGAARSCR